MKHILYILILLLLLACEEETNWHLQSSNTQRIVVDATLTNEMKRHTVKLFYTTDTLNAIPEPVTDANVQILYNNITVNCSEDILKPGNYYTDSMMAAVDVEYKLVFTKDDFIDSTKAEAIGVTPLNDIYIAETDSMYRYYYGGSTGPCKMEVYYNWSHDEEYTQKYGYENAMEIFYTLENLDVTEMFAPEKQRVEFPAGTQIIRKKYSLSDRHQEFIRHLLLETEWRGGVFDVEPGNVPSYFYNGTLGFFSVSMVKSDTSIYFP